jgi:hypothetical protein
VKIRMCLVRDGVQCGDKYVVMVALEIVGVIAGSNFFSRNMLSTRCIKIEEKGWVQMRWHPGDQRHDYATQLQGAT